VCLRTPCGLGMEKAAGSFLRVFVRTRLFTLAYADCRSLSIAKFSPISETPGRVFSPSSSEVLPVRPPALKTKTHF
jgi:hypothetical protein